MKSFPDIFCIIDTETTGMKAARSRIMDIAIIRVENGKVVERYETFLNPDTHIPMTISMITGITGEHLVEAPRFHDVAHDIKKLLEGAVFVAHNVSFDYSFIQEEFRRLGMVYEAPKLCSVRLSRLLYPTMKRHNLDAIIERHGIKVTNRHRAMPDAKAVLEFFKHIEKTFDAHIISSALEKILQVPEPKDIEYVAYEEPYEEETISLS